MKFNFYVIDASEVAEAATLNEALAIRRRLRDGLPSRIYMPGDEVPEHVAAKVPSIVRQARLRALAPKGGNLRK